MDQEDDYEAARQERIRRNKQFLQAINLKNPVVASQPSKPKRASPAPMQAVEAPSTPSRRSSRIKPRINFREVESVGDSDDEDDAVASRLKKRKRADDDSDFESNDDESDDDVDDDFPEPSLRIAPKIVIDLNKVSAVETATIEALQQSSQCHVCNQWTAQKKAHCRNIGCTLQFCRKCLSVYDELLTEVIHDADWICPACRLVCMCDDHKKARNARFASSLSQALQGSSHAAKSVPATTLPTTIAMDFTSNEDDSDEEDDDDGVYSVEKIIDSRVTSGSREYLCKFTGWPESASAWMPASQLEQTCADLLDLFLGKPLGSTAPGTHKVTLFTAASR